MSDLQDKNSEPICNVTDCSGVQLVIEAKQKDLGELVVKRTLPSRKQRMVGPWIFFDHMGSATFATRNGISVRPHPHIHLATVTYLFEGEIFHRDSLGNAQAILPGAINLMIAGRGITHSEREREEIKDKKRVLHGLQLWLALPENDQNCEPQFYHHPAGHIPGKNINGVPVRLLIGEAYSMKSPVKTYSETLYLEAQLKKGQSLELPESAERGLYIVKGSLEIDGHSFSAESMLILNNKKIEIKASRDLVIALIGGANIGPRFIEWNFVSTHKEHIEQAKKDWREGRFAKVPGDEKEFIPLP